MMDRVVIVGAGQAGLQVGISLRELGYGGRVTIVGDEPGLPYQRPPLSKAFLTGKVEEEGLHLRKRSVLDELRLELAAPERVSRIDRDSRVVGLGSGRSLPYQHLVLATGTRSIALPVPGGDLQGVVSLRSLDDARHLRTRLAEVRKVVVVGAGFIGLEFAAVAAARGVQVHVMEAASRVMARVVSPEMSAYFLRRHAGRGTIISLDAAVTEIIGDGGRAAGVRTGDGTVVPADLVLVGIGVRANDELARDAGLAVDRGVVVDDNLLTADPAISAIGDCAAHPNATGDGLVRLESVQNAIDQAKSVAARLTGRPAPYRAVPWFWSDQGDDKLQIAGLTAGSETRIVHGDEPLGRFAVFCFRGGRFTGLETVNRPADHLAARKVLASGAALGPDVVAAPAFSLKTFLATAQLAA